MQLDQDLVWVDKDGHPHSLAMMEPRHRANVLRWIIRNAPSLKEQYEWKMLSFARGVIGEIAADDFDTGFEQVLAMGAEEWVRQTPLVMRLEKLVAEDEHLLREIRKQARQREEDRKRAEREAVDG